PYAETMASEFGRRLSAVLAAGVTQPPAPRHRWLRRGRIDLVAVADLATALICWGVTGSLLETWNGQHGHPRSTQELLFVSLMLSAPLALRTYFPFTAWSASAVAMIWTSWVIPPRSMSTAAYVP